MSEGDASRRRSHVEARSIKTEADVAPIASLDKPAKAKPAKKGVAEKPAAKAKKTGKGGKSAAASRGGEAGQGRAAGR